MTSQESFILERIEKTSNLIIIQLEKFDTINYCMRLQTDTYYKNLSVHNHLYFCLIGI